MKILPEPQGQRLSNLRNKREYVFNANFVLRAGFTQQIKRCFLVLVPICVKYILPGIKSGSSDVTILVTVQLLKPLGNPPQHSVKYFAASELLEQVKDRAWLAKVTNALNQHW